MITNILKEFDEAMKPVKLTLVVAKENKEWCALCGYNPDEFRSFLKSSLKNILDEVRLERNFLISGLMEDGYALAIRDLEAKLKSLRE